MTLPTKTLRLRKKLRRHLLGGHPWVMSQSFSTGALSKVEVGELVLVVDEQGPIGVGFGDPGCPIAVRLLSTEVESAGELDEQWIQQVVRRASQRRLIDPHLQHSSGVRLIHGENDFLPGLVIDQYSSVLSIGLDGEGPAAFWRPRLPIVVDALSHSGSAVVRQRGKPATWIGAEKNVVEIEENGAKFAVDVMHGQKTGFFLDQRESRKRVGELSGGQSVLNLFSYTGGFSVHAALQGARQVTSVDIAGPAIEGARNNFRLNNLSPTDHEFVVSDVGNFLSQSRDRRWDIVIVDPPSYAPREKDKAKALRAYESVNRQALQVVASGGILVSCSCSSHVNESELWQAVSAAAQKSNRTLVATQFLGAGSDHPVRPGFPEGRYLNSIFCRVD